MNNLSVISMRKNDLDHHLCMVSAEAVN